MVGQFIRSRKINFIDEQYGDFSFTPVKGDWNSIVVFFHWKIIIVGEGSKISHWIDIFEEKWEALSKRVVVLDRGLIYLHKLFIFNLRLIIIIKWVFYKTLFLSQKLYK